MHSRWLVLLFFIAGTALTLGGCINSRGDSFGSAWTGLEAVATASGTTDVATPTVTLSPTVLVLPTSSTLGQQQSTPITVKVTTASGTIDNVDVFLTNSLDGTFAAATGKVSSGIFATTFTSGMANGLCTISATCLGATGTAAIQVNGQTMITVTPARATMNKSESQVISVLVTDERGTRLNDVEVYMDSSAGGTFADASVKTANGLAYFTYTAPNVLILTTDTLKALALGTSASIPLTIQP